VTHPTNAPTRCAARAVGASSGAQSGRDWQYVRWCSDVWRALMEPARRAVRRLVAAGEVEITQGGRVVDPSTAKGQIWVRRAG